MCFILNHFAEQFKSVNYFYANRKLLLMVEASDPNYPVNFSKLVNFQHGLKSLPGKTV